MNMKIYIASKAVHRARWRQLRDAGAPFNSRWIDIPDHIPDEDIDFRELWNNCIEDVYQCDVLIVVVTAGERLKGVLVELGAAIAWGKRVIVLGDPGRDNGTWVNHPVIEWQPQGSIENTLTHLTDSI
jgi:nucleoside 2-deoxyribosyltransferase